jgi:hypothetical protein
MESSCASISDSLAQEQVRKMPAAPGRSPGAFSRSRMRTRNHGPRAQRPDRAEDTSDARANPTAARCEEQDAVIGAAPTGTTAVPDVPNGFALCRDQRGCLSPIGSVARSIFENIVGRFHGLIGCFCGEPAVSTRVTRLSLPEAPQAPPKKVRHGTEWSKMCCRHPRWSRCPRGD